MRSEAAALRRMYARRRGSSAQLTGLEMKSVAPASNARLIAAESSWPGHHDDGNGGKTRLRAQPPAHRVAVHAGHVDVQQYDGHFV